MEGTVSVKKKKKKTLLNIFFLQSIAYTTDM